MSTHLIDHQYGVENDTDVIVSNDTLISTGLIPATLISTDLIPATSSEPEDQETPEDVPKRKLKNRYRYVGDFRPSDLKDPKKIESCFETLKESLKQKNKRIKTLKQKVRRLETKVGDLKSLVNYLYKLSHK